MPAWNVGFGIIPRLAGHTKSCWGSCHQKDDTETGERYMKKKMTVAEFEEWSRFASEIRDKTLVGEIVFEEYYAEIRK